MDAYFRGRDVRENSCELRCAPVEEQPEPVRDFDRTLNDIGRYLDRIDGTSFVGRVFHANYL